MFLVLHRAQQHRIRQVDHLRHAPACRPKQRALRFRGAINDVVRRAQKLPNQLRLVFIEGALQVRRQEAVHDIHARRQAQFRHVPQNQCLVGSLLRILADDHDPPGVECTINIVVTAVHVERMLGERPRAYFEHHRRTFARRVIVLLHAVDHALSRGEVHHALAAHRVCNGAALGRVLAFGFDGQRIAPEDIEFAFGKCLLEELAALCGRCDGVEHACVGNPRLRVIRDKLVSVGGNSNAGITRGNFHKSLP